MQQRNDTNFCKIACAPATDVEHGMRARILYVLVKLLLELLRAAQYHLSAFDMELPVRVPSAGRPRGLCIPLRSRQKECVLGFAGLGRRSCW